MNSTHLRPIAVVMTAAASVPLSLLALPATAGPPSAAAAKPSTAVVGWSEVAGQAAVAGCLAPGNDPLHEARMYAMTHLAVHDALNSIHRRFDPYAERRRAPAMASPEAAVAEAAHDVLVASLEQTRAFFGDACSDAGIAVVQSHYADVLGHIGNGPAKRAGRAAGARAAATILAARSDDGSATLPLVDPDYPQGTEPGQWRFTPGVPFAFEPRWGEVDLFALKKVVNVAPPLDLRSRRYAKDLNEVKALGGVDSTARTADQTEIARFWLESSPLAWNRIGRQLALARGLDLWQQARLFGLLNMAMADGYVSTFATKYADTFWRPVTAIHEAGSDGNPRTAADPAWMPLEQTPPIPDHDSGHAVEGATAAAVFQRFFGTDRMSFSNCTNTIPGHECGSADPVVRHFSSFSAAARENARSRIYVGFHFRYATEVGLGHGAQIGSYAAAHYLRPAS